MKTGCKIIARVVGLCAVLALGLPRSSAQAFCGFFVAGADTSLYANATMVVLMRDGMRTVLSMQNNYQGPPEAFALVIPVPAVLQKEQVRTLPKDVFKHVDTLAAPRLVEYWEVDPCRPQFDEDEAARPQSGGSAADAGTAGGVTVEAQFTVAEYDIVILSANDSSGLESWLIANHYNIPVGAKDVLQPYVAAGTKFFVAKVDPQRVTFENKQAVLSPLRFYYDAPDFSLPVRLGLLNSQGTQDLIVSILAPSRYELANHPNVMIPTNIRVQDAVRDSFPDFYEALFAKTLEKAPMQAVVTEYAWNANSCDPCPTPPLTSEDLATLGADITQGLGPNKPYPTTDYVLTRLHYRYTKETLGEDLLFKEAAPLVGGRGIPDRKGDLEDTTASSNAGVNNFQGRYIILHPWDKAISCQQPQRGLWGGPEGSTNIQMSMGLANNALVGAPPKAGDLPQLLAESLAVLDVVATHPIDPFAGASGNAGSGGKGGAGGQAGSLAADGGTTSNASSDSGCSCSAPGARGLHGWDRSMLWGLGLCGLIGAGLRARRRL